MNINQLTTEICKRIKSQPFYLVFLFLDIFVTIIYFPKYLYYLVKREKIVAFDWGSGIYSNFYWPLFERLNKCGLRIVFFFHFGNAKQYGMTLFKKGLPKIYGDLLDNKIVICASAAKYAKLNKTVRVQIFHGLGSFSVLWQRDFVDSFDVLFLATKFQWQQLQGEKKEWGKGKKVFRIGYPKIDNYISAEGKKENERYNKMTLFYGPTSHHEISSIFEFLSTIAQMCERNNYRLIIKIHPLLYHKHNREQSGGVDWAKKICEYKKNYNDIVFLKGNKNDLGKYFTMTDVFLTDVSGLGFEFVLTTAKPIIFLGDKLKVPLEDLRKGNVKKYENCPEVCYRGKIGPIVREPRKLEETVKKMIENDAYKTEREKCRKEYVFNLGTASDVAVSAIKRIYEEL